jgi:ribosomal protein S5
MGHELLEVRVADEFTEQTEFIDKIVHVNRVAKVKKEEGALAALAPSRRNRAGRVGAGLGKLMKFPAIRKAIESQKELTDHSVAGTTIPHRIVGHYGAGRVLLPQGEEQGLSLEDRYEPLWKLLGSLMY